LKVKLYSKNSAELSGLIYNKLYDLQIIENGWYRVINEEGEEELFPSALFTIVSGKEDDIKSINHALISLLKTLRNPNRKDYSNG
jgi:hypothetical protein